MQSLATPTDEPVVRLVEHPVSHVRFPPAAGERFTRIEIALFAGRSLAAKRALYRSLVEQLGEFGVPLAAGKIVPHEVTAENVGFRGGQAACDVDLGYDVQV